MCEWMNDMIEYDHLSTEREVGEYSTMKWKGILLFETAEKNPGKGLLQVK